MTATRFSVTIALLGTKVAAMLTRKTLYIVLLTLPLMACSGPDQSQAANSGEMPSATAKMPARVWIVNPDQGDSVTSPVIVEFGIAGYGLAPAGTYEPETGHHHLLINTGLPALDMPIPADDNHVHFGKGQTETTIDLPAGEHTLQLVLGDGNHIPHQPPLTSDVITITVVD